MDSPLGALPGNMPTGSRPGMLLLPSAVNKLGPATNNTPTGTPVLATEPDIGAADAPRGTPTAVVIAPPASPPNQFQRFVQANTGQLLPFFGASLFDTPFAYAADNAAPAPSEYVLGPGDEVRLQIWGAVDYAGSQTLDRNGQIQLPKIGSLNLNGVQVKDLETVLKKHIATVFTNVSVNASLGKLRGITVYVVGQARKPGTYNLTSLSTLVNALFASGGPSAGGSMRKIELKRGGKTITTLDLYDFIARGDKSRDAPLQPGDVIMIPPAGPRVALTGATDHGAVYELLPGSSIQDVLALGGGLPSLSKPQIAQLERLNPGNEKTPRQVRQIALQGAGLSTALQDGDVLTLLPLQPAFENAVTLRGNVATPLRYSHQSGMRISDLIPELNALIQADYYKRKNLTVQMVGGAPTATDRSVYKHDNLLEEINWDYAVIERLDLKNLKSELLPFNLGRAVRDKNPADNLVLQPGDIVTIFGVKDVPVPVEKRNQFVSIYGEVKVPGIYQIKPGETMNQLVARVGGITGQAYAYGTVFVRESNRRQQQANLDLAVRRIEADISSQSANLLQNSNDAEKTTLSAQIALQKSMVDRLKVLKATGRIALEMNTTQPEFPTITLEDGDVITVPTQPSFVSVFGAVFSETGFIWRPKATVEDYLNKAGPNRQADLDAALIVRADGTVVASDAHRSFIGWGQRNFMATPLQAGDSVFVPELIDRRTAYTQFMQGAKDWTQILYQFGLGIAGLKSLKN